MPVNKRNSYIISISYLVHSLKCHVNAAANIEPVPTDCKTDEICRHEVLLVTNGVEAIKRSCIPKGKDGITAGNCTKEMDKPVCACDTDNCNHECTAVNCKRIENGKDVPIELVGKTICDANCKAPEGGSGNGDGAKTTGKADGTGQAATGDGSQTVAEPNKYALAFWILTVLVTFLLTY